MMATKRVCDECGHEADVIWDVEIKASRMDSEPSTGTGVTLAVPRHQAHRGDLCNACLSHMATPFAVEAPDTIAGLSRERWQPVHAS